MSTLQIKRNSLSRLARILVGVLLISALLFVANPRPAHAVTTALPPAFLDGCIVELSPAGYLRGVSVQNDGLFIGSNLQLYHLGTTPKILLSWDSYNSAYVLEHYLSFHETSLLGFVWDVSGQSTSAGAKLHVWSRHNPKDAKSTSQNWLFLPQTDGTYYIKNVRSGLYASLTSTASGSDFDGNQLVLSAAPLKWNLEILDVQPQAGSSAQTNPYEIYSCSSYFDMVDWMKHLDDDTPLTMVSMPGAHDMGTANANGSENPQISLTQCQKLYVKEQLAVGVRYFDLRLGIDFLANLDPVVFHGDFICYNKDESFLRLSEVMEEFYNFLDEYPNETLIVLVSNANSAADEENITLSIEKYLSASPERFWDEEAIPTLGDVRGKIVMFHRYNVTGNTLNAELFGLDLSAWGSYDDTFRTEKKAVKIYDQNSIEVWVQDYYNTNATTKIDYVTATLTQAAEVLLGNAYLINYTSCTSSNPFSAARNMNQTLATKTPFSATTTEPVGIVVMDYIGANWCRKIVEQNFGEPAPAVIMPNTVSLVYGQTLDEGQLNRGFSRHDGIFGFENPDFMPRVADSGTIISFGFSLFSLLGAGLGDEGLTPEGMAGDGLVSLADTTSSITLIVLPRPVEVGWSFGGSLGGSLGIGDQLEGSIVAQITNLVGDDICQVQFAVFDSAGLLVTSDSYLAEGVYRVQVTNLIGNDADNYTFDPNLAAMTFTVSGTPGSLVIPATGDSASLYPFLLVLISLAALCWAARLKLPLPFLFHHKHRRG